MAVKALPGKDGEPIAIGVIRLPDGRHHQTRADIRRQRRVFHHPAGRHDLPLAASPATARLSLRLRQGRLMKTSLEM